MGALEMIESPDVAIVQHTSGVLRVAHNVFETGSESNYLQRSRSFLMRKQFPTSQILYIQPSLLMSAAATAHVYVPKQSFTLVYLPKLVRWP